jgi:hypothetical protein
MPSASYLKRRFPVGTKYVIESCGPFVRRHVELPSGERIRLSPRKASTCTCAERQIGIVPEHAFDALDDVPASQRRIFA